MSQYPDLSASDDFSVEILRQMIKNYIFKDSPETRASTTTVADDTDLIVPVEANARTHIKFVLHAAAILAEDFKTAWSAPAGAS